MSKVKVPTGIFINGIEQYISKDPIELHAPEELRKMLKAAREEAATYRIKAREKAEAEQKLESLQNQITYWKNLSRDYENLYQSFKSKYEADDPYLLISEKREEVVKQFTTKPLSNKQNDTMEQPIILTENADLYQFRRGQKPIIEIMIAKSEVIKKERNTDCCKVWYQHLDGRIGVLSCDINGRCSSNSAYDLILKPVPKTRPMTHAEIMELRAKGAVFQHKECKSENSGTFVTITAYYQDAQRYYFESGVYRSYDLFVENYNYSLDNTKTWLPLTVEET